MRVEFVSEEKWKIYYYDIAGFAANMLVGARKKN
jgi:hypothetical protein